MLERLRRAATFARHIPASRLIRRIELSARRWLRDRSALQQGPPPPAPPRSSAPPRPLFPPRVGLAPRTDGDALVFRFLNVEARMRRDAIDWRGSGDQLWLMNLHYLEWLEGVDDALWAEAVGQWLDANGEPAPGAWRFSWNSYALSLRAVVLMQELARRPSLAADLRARVEAHVAKQIEFLERNLETDIGGNHLIKNVKALLWAAAYFEGERAERWRAEGLALLGAELATQVLPDGVHFERSPSYHGQVFADLLECRAALGADPFEGRLDGALARLAQATADLVHPDGAVAQFNDAGLEMAYAPAVCLDAFAAISGERPRPRDVFAFPQAGYFGARSVNDYVVADCGRIAPDELPAHGHGDVLSFELSVANLRIIVDQGVFEYVAGRKRARSRAASSHNTVSIVGADQAEFFGAFRCGRRPNVVLRRYEPRAQGFFLEGAHDGYANLPGAPVHVRSFAVAPGEILIRDAIEGRLDRAARAGFLLHPEVEAVVAGHEARLARGRAEVVMTASAALAIEAAVWWPNMGVERPTRRLVFDLPRGEGSSSVLLRWRRGF